MSFDSVFYFRAQSINIFRRIVFQIFSNMFHIDIKLAGYLPYRNPLAKPHAQ